MYDYIIVTHIPAFYKVNLYNQLTKKSNILVVFIASDTSEKRADDFVSLENIKFDYKILFDGDFQDRNIIKSIISLKQILNKVSYQKIIVSGWDLKEFWYIIFTNKKSKNCLALESTINESIVNGIRGFMKKIFLGNTSTVFASGKLHVELLNALNYKDKTKVTKGVGIINKPAFESIKREYKKRFLFIGRLSSEKNIKQLIEIFNTLPKFTLTIVGTGPQEMKLKNMAKQNIRFLGQVKNCKIKEQFLSNDIFILPSTSEPWGLVVEEALYFKMPVMISRNCGASELIENGVNGYVLDSLDTKNIKNTITRICTDKYMLLLDGIERYSVDEKDKIQVESYDI